MKVLSDSDLKALACVQDIISRMANSSHRVKLYYLACTLINGAAILVSSVPQYSLIAMFLLVTLVFWYIDAQYLQLERKFRKHHNAVVCSSMKESDVWRMDVNVYNAPFLKCFFSFSQCLYPAMGCMIVCLGVQA